VAERTRRTLGIALTALLLAAALAAGALVLRAVPGRPDELWVDVPDATGLYPGAAIREAGLDVGGVASVQPIDHGRRARVGLRFHPGVWPIRRGIRLRLRWGGTISFLGDYVDLVLPGGTGPAYRNGATLPSTALSVPVQFDTLLDDFTPAVRRGVRSLISSGAGALATARPDLVSTLARTPPALEQANVLLGELDRSRTALAQLLDTSGRVVDALQTAQPSTEQLVSGAAGTLSATAAQASALRATIAAAPRAFSRVGATLRRAERTLVLTGRVTTLLGPGVTQLHETLPSVRTLLTRVEQIGPPAEATLSTAGRSAPQITALLDKTTALSPTLGSDLRQAVPELGCIRPYTPDIVSFFTNWSAFLSPSTGHNHIARVVPSAITGALSGAEMNTPGEVVGEFPGLTDSFPQPPGYAAGQPWFQPQCGISAASLKAADDPEAGAPDGAPLPAPTGAAGATR
jgi:ABC-type transporter Mla subunit MlaD